MHPMYFSLGLALLALLILAVVWQLPKSSGYETGPWPIGEKFNKQRVYNMVKNHLLTQKESSRNEKGDCVYRSPSGLKCAIGALFPDSLYLPTLEGKSVSACGVHPNCDLAITLRTLFGKPLWGDEINFLQDLQAIHDCNNPKSWALSLARFADKQGLQA